MIIKNDLFDYKNRYIFQETAGFKFSLDSILLAEFVKIPKKEVFILDMCTGNAPVPLILSTKTNNPIIGFEIQKDIYALAQKSVDYNKCNNQIKIYNEDIKNIYQIFPGKYFDIITCNPPYFSTKQDGHINKNSYLTIARHEIMINLEDIFKIVKDSLKENGSFYMVHRTDRLDEIILMANKYKIYLKEVQLIITKNNIPSIVLLRFQKNAKFGLKINKVIDINKLKTYQNMFKEDA